ncbi:MAG TPA: nucleoside hydrolase [Candidatus Scatosoma pullistercoris]|uniref:Nucleoside hydrolase n=1 Tax=Candidatus Scatosoma pullistercoris TaxID=2840934 RepID=A0A9D1SGI3_9FIRM|nr:nucleoside hydrolase [Candidatus Scatosoma pullistercoris]
MKKYIIDTDIGDDIDDAFALDLALKKDLGLLGVTTVFRDTQSRARIVKKLLRLYGKQLPVYAGYGATLDGREDKGRLCQWTPDLDNPEYRPDNSSPEAAVDAILDAARRYGKEFYLLAIGPLTNVARAILKDRETMLKCGGLIMMGGDFVNHYVEWNIHCDVAAAEIVFSSGMEIVAFGHEVTSRARLTPVQQEYVFSMAQDEYHAYLAELSRLWHRSKPTGFLMVLHDVLAVRYAAEPEFCRLRRAPVGLEHSGKYTSGMTVNLSAMDLLNVPEMCTVRYAAEVDIAEFIGYFMNEIGYRAEGGKAIYEKVLDNSGKFMLDRSADRRCDELRQSGK